MALILPGEAQRQRRAVWAWLEAHGRRQRPDPRG